MNQTNGEVVRKGFSGLQVTGIVLVTVVVTVFAGWWLVRTYIFPDKLKPVELTQTEQVELDRKLERLGWATEIATVSDSRERAVPQPYGEDDADREVFLTERELNGMIANDPDLASSMAIDLADDLVSFTLLVPIPQDFPVMPGRTLRVRGGAEVAYTGGRPVVAIKGVSLMGVPVPNAWLGNLKNVDLVGEFGDAGFWKAFSDGVEDISVQQGRIRVMLRQ